MVSEARKPLVMSMAFLALFSAIIIGVGTYMIINNLKDAKGSLVPQADNSTHLSQPVTGKSKPTLKKMAKKLSLIFKMKKLMKKMKKKTGNLTAKQIEAYNKLLDQVDEGKLTYSQDALFERFKRDYYTSSDERIKEDSKKYLSKNMRIVGISEIQISPITYYSLKSAFGVSGSEGMLLLFDPTGSCSKVSFQSSKSAQDFISQAGFKVYVDKVLDIKKKICHVAVAAAGADEESAKNFTDENIKVLTEKLLEDHESITVESIKALKVPEKFALFVGISPEESEKVEPNVQNNKEGSLIIENVFKDADSRALYIGHMGNVLKSADFVSREHYNEFLKNRGITFIDHIKIFNGGVPYEIIFGGRTAQSIKILRLNIEKALWLILQRLYGVNGRTISFNEDADLQQLLLNRENVAVLIVVPEKIKDINISFNSNFQHEEIVKTEIISGTFSNSYSKFFKVYDNDNTTSELKGYRFACVSADRPDGSVNSAKVKNLNIKGYSVIVRGNPPDDWLEDFVDGVAKCSNEEEIQMLWIAECKSPKFSGEISIQIG